MKIDSIWVQFVRNYDHIGALPYSAYKMKWRVNEHKEFLKLNQKEYTNYAMC